MDECLRQLSDMDSGLLLFLNNMHNGFLDNLMLCLSDKWVWAPLYGSILLLMLRNFSVRTVVTYVVAIALTVAIADQIGASVIRPIVERMRPSNPDNPISGSVHIVNGYRGGRFGFPSCHAANTFGLVFFLIYMLRSRVLTAFLLLWATAVCYSRIYLGVHYPGDILAGIVIGMAVATAAYGLARMVDKPERPSAYKWLHLPWVMGGATVLLMAIYALAATVQTA